MRPQLTSILAICLFLSACKPHQLAWIDDANAEKMAARDTAQGRFRFFSVCGYACFVPGVGTTNAKHCFSKVVVQHIEGTGDAYTSDEEGRLIVKAHNFAEKYNLLVESHLKRENKSQCDPSTDWDKGFRALHQYVQSLNDNALEAGQVALIANRSEFKVTLPLNVSFKQASPELCKRLISHGLVGVAVVRLIEREKPDAVATTLDCVVKQGA